MQEHRLGRLLIVDDELELTNALCEMLNKHGYLAVGFSSGQAALKALAESEFDILLTDMMMPEMDGIALMRAALRVDQNLVAFMMTGQGSVQTAVEAMKVGAFDYVLKPFKLSALLPVLDRAMEVRRLRVENVQLHETVSIYELTTTIAYSLDLNTIMNKTVEAAREQLNADEVSLMRSTRLGDELYVAAVCGEGREKILGERVRLEQGIAGWVARYRESVNLYGDVDDARFAPLFPRSDIGPALSMPMLVGNKLVGVLNVNVRQRRPSFTLGQVKGLMILASVAASALESASLYAQVQEAEARYHSIFANAINGIFQTTPDGRFTLANPALARMLGFSSPEELISSVSDIATQIYVDPARWGELQRQLQESGKIEGFEFEARCKDGSSIWISENVLVVSAENGDVLYYEGTAENATRRKHAEEQVIASEASYRRLFEAARDGILILDAKTGVVKDVNPFLVEMLGIRAEEIIGKELWELGFFKDIASNKANFLELQQKGYIRYEDLPLETRDGRKFQVEFVSNVYLVNHHKVVQCNIRDITERKRAEETLQKSEKRFRSLIEHSMEEISLIDSHGTLTWESPTIRRPLGYPPNSFVGQSLIDLIHPDERRAATRLLKKIQPHPGRVREGVFRVRHQDGSWRWMEAVFSNLLDEPAVQSLVINYRDVTERKLAEEELLTSEERYRLLVETLPDGVIVHSQGRVVFANAASAKIIGMANPAELIGKPVMEFVHPDYRGSTLERIRQSLSKDIPAPAMEEKFVRIDGTLVDVEVAAIPFFYAGSPAMLTVFNDITARKHAEDALRLSEEKYRTLVDEVNDGFCISDARGIFSFANPAMARIYGFETPQALIGRKFMDFIAPEAMAELSHSARSTMHSTQAPEVINGQIVRLDGTRAFIEIKAVSVLQDGQIVGSQGVVRDVTERKRAEEKLEEERILLRTLIDNLPDQIYIMDVQGRKIVSNIADWQASGRKSMEEVIGKTDLEIYPAELAKDYWAMDKSVIDSGNALINLEEPGQDTRGEPLWLLSSKVPIRDARGKVVGLVGIGRNITERKEKEEEIRLRSAELEALYKFSRHLAEADDLAAVIQQVIQNAVESIHTTFAGLLLLEATDLVPYAVYPVNVFGQDFILGERQPVNVLPICQSVLEKNEPVTLHAEVSEVGCTERQVLLLDFAQSVCLVPLRVGDAGQGRGIALGLLILGETRTDSREPFTPGKLSLARSIGDQAAAAIRRMLLREQAGRRLQQLASLSEIDRTIASIMDLRISLQMILRHVCERLEVDAAGVLVFNETLQSLEYAAGRGLRSQDILGTRQRLGEGLAGKVALERQMVQIPDISASRAVFGRQNFNKVERVAAYFAVPLINKGKLKGVLEVYQRSPLYPNQEWLDFLNTLAGQAAIAIDNVQMFEHLQRSTDELELAYDATIEGWSHALDLRDKETEGHTRRVTEITVKLARRFGISEKDLVQVRWGALLHDIGKMGVPDGILLKPGPLTDEEWVVMKKHPGLAYDMLKPIGYLRQALDIPYCHHEKWDGSGYPRGLKGEQIPLVARIFAVVDVWDAITSDRPYRLAWPQEKARQHILDGAATHFDPQVVEKFFQEVD